MQAYSRRRAGPAQGACGGFAAGGGGTGGGGAEGAEPDGQVVGAHPAAGVGTGFGQKQQADVDGRTGENLPVTKVNDAAEVLAGGQKLAERLAGLGVEEFWGQTNRVVGTHKTNVPSGSTGTFQRRVWTKYHRPNARISGPERRPPWAPSGAIFSSRTKTVSAPIHPRFITPPTKSKSISAQQQPRQ